MQGMQSFKSILKAMLRGTVLLGFGGIFVGAIVAMVIWPGSNSGPPAGMVYGFIWGALVGAMLGFGFGVVRSIRVQASDENSENKTS